MIKRSTTLRAVTIRRQVLMTSARPLRARCNLCGRDVDLLTVIEAGTAVDADEETMKRLIEEERVHLTRTVNGRLLICKDSLFVS